MRLLRFAGATSYKNAKFVIFGVPYDATSSFRPGSRSGANAIRMASYNFEEYDLEYGVLAGVHDAGDLDVNVPLDDVHRLVESFVASLDGDKISIMLGGEHTFTYSSVKSFGKEIGVVILDAHLDLRNEFHGSKLSHACTSRRILELVGPDNYVGIGMRSCSEDEYKYGEERSIRYYWAEDVFKKGVDSITKEVIAYLPREIYLSIDMDVIDPAYAPAVSNPEPFGLTSRVVRDMIRKFAPLVKGFDLMEVTPGYDHGETALLGAKLINELIGSAKKSAHLGVQPYSYQP